MLRPLRILLESVKLSERLIAQFCDGLLQLWMKNVDKEIVKK